MTITKRLQRGAASRIGASLSGDECVRLMRLIDAVREVSAELPPYVRHALLAMEGESDD